MIAIIGILAAIIIPTVSSVRAQAHRATCVSNLRQIGMAIRMYVDDNRGLLPPPVVGTDSEPVGGVQSGWPYYIQPYMVSSGTPKITGWKPFVITGVMRCPSNNIDEPDVKNAEWSYKINDNIRTKRSVNPDEASLPFAKVARPTRTLQMADGREPGQPGNTRFNAPDKSTETGSTNPGGMSIAFPHKGKANCLFVDGHVESLTKPVLVKDWDNYHEYKR